MTKCTNCARSSIVSACILFLACGLSVDASASLTNDVEVIRSVLSTWNEAGYLRSFSYMWPNGMTIGEYLTVALGVAPSWSPQDSLISVLSDIRARSGTSWTTNDIVRLLSAVNAARSPWSSNDVSSVRSDVSDLLLWLRTDLSGWSDSNYNPALSVKDYDLINLLGFIYQTYDMEGDYSLRVHDHDVYDILSDIHSAVGNDIENLLRAIRESIEDSGADISGNLHDAFSGSSNIVAGVEELQARLDALYQFQTNSLAYASKSEYESDLQEAERDTSSYEPSLTTNALAALVVDRPEELSQFESVADSFEQRISSWGPNTGGSAEIVVIPEMTIGGIHVREYRASLATSLTPVARAVMSFIWGVMAFAACFHLLQGEWAFYTSLGRGTR